MANVNIFIRPKQDAKQRFGIAFDAANETVMSGNTYDDGYLQDFPNQLPQFESWRMNLTAFSQHYNLYFVAMQNQIYVYRPRNLDQAITGKPDAVIRPPPITGLPKPNSIFPRHPHCVNSFIIGDLGNLEVILIAFDDGDIYAYYTKDIEDIVQSRATDRNLSALASIRPLLSESIEDSAWGLACHKELRIIAVSSNSRVITMFWFALSDSDCPDTSEALRNVRISAFDMVSDPVRDRTSWHLWPAMNGTHKTSLVTGALLKYGNRLHTPGFRQQRRINTQIKLNMYAGKLKSENIPMLAFSQSPEQVILIAQDIGGNVFIITLSELLYSDEIMGEILIRKVGPPLMRGPLNGTQFGSGWATTIIEPELFFIESLRPAPLALFCASNEAIAVWPINSIEDSELHHQPHLHLSNMQLDIEVINSRRCQDKLSLLLKIAELHLVIVGSPIGTVVLLNMSCDEHSRPRWRTYTVVPTTQQQFGGDRPSAVLVGIAAAPIQGEEDLLTWSKKTRMVGRLPSDSDYTESELCSRRFRLLLHYDDHTILSYELSRDHDGGVDCVMADSDDTDSSTNERFGTLLEGVGALGV